MSYSYRFCVYSTHATIANYIPCKPSLWLIMSNIIPHAVTIPHTTLLTITMLSEASLPSPDCFQYGRTEEEAADEEHTEERAEGNHTKDSGQEDDPPGVVCSIGECVSEQGVGVGERES